MRWRHLDIAFDKLEDGRNVVLIGSPRSTAQLGARMDDVSIESKLYERGSVKRALTLTQCSAIEDDDGW